MALKQYQIKVMLEIQNKINTYIDDDWVNKGWPLMRGVVVECSNALERGDWHWWKNQEDTSEKIKIELIEIWHFYLSFFLVMCKGNLPQAMIIIKHKMPEINKKRIFFDEKRYSLEAMNILEKFDLLSGLAVAKRIELNVFNSIMIDCGMGWDTLYRQYIAKNVLNTFRSHHGLKEGKYMSNWDGISDKAYLLELLDNINMESSNIFDLIYNKLKVKYNEVKGYT